MIEQSFVSILNTSDKKNPWRAGQTYPPHFFSFLSYEIHCKEIIGGHI